MNENNKILEKLLNIQIKLKAPKSQYNNFGKYKYRNLEDITEAIKPLLQEEKAILNISDELVLIGNRYYIKAKATLLCTETSSLLSSVGYAREEESKKGMDSSQLTGSTSSYARKYALNGLFALDDTKDADFSTEQQESTKQQPTKQELTEKQLNRLYTIAREKGFTDESVKEFINKRYKKDSAKNLTKEEYEETCNRLQKSATRKEVEKVEVMAVYE